MEGSSESGGDGLKLTLVARKPLFGLPTACPYCLPVFIYLKLARIPFLLDVNLSMPDSDQIPYVELGAYAAYNNEKGGVIEFLREDGIADLDSRIGSVPDFVSMKAMIGTWLNDAVEYELWIVPGVTPAYQIYYSDLPWPIGKLLFLKQMHTLRHRFGIAKDNAKQREAEIYSRAHMAYEALSSGLGEDDFFFEDRPSSLDAVFLGHAFFTLRALPESSVLRSKLLEHGNLVRYAEKHKAMCLDATSPSYFQSFMPTWSSASRQGAEPKKKQRKERTEEEKAIRKRAKYFLSAQVVAIISFLTIMNRSAADGDVDFDAEGDDDVGYD